MKNKYQWNPEESNGVLLKPLFHQIGNPEWNEQIINAYDLAKLKQEEIKYLNRHITGNDIKRAKQKQKSNEN